MTDPEAPKPVEAAKADLASQLKVLTDFEADFTQRQAQVEQQQGERYRGVLEEAQKRSQQRADESKQRLATLEGKVPGEAPKPGAEPPIPSNQPKATTRT